MKHTKMALALVLVAALLLGGCARRINFLANLIAPSTTTAPAASPAAQPDIAKPTLPTLPPVTQAENGIFNIDDGYFALLDATYADLAAAYGEARIYCNMEWGLYASFESVRLTVFFVHEMYESHYPSLDYWLMDDAEFTAEPDYADRYYTGSRYAPSDFAVAYVEIWGEGVPLFLGCEGPVTLAMVSEHFDIAHIALNLNAMYDIYTTETYQHGDYGLTFTVTPSGNDYLVESVSLNSYDPDREAYHTDSGLGLFYRELVGDWHFDDELLEKGELITLTINEDLSFDCFHTDSKGMYIYRGDIIPEWNFSRPDVHMPDMITFQTNDASDTPADGGAYGVRLLWHDGTWQLHLTKYAGGKNLIDLLVDSEKATLSRIEPDNNFPLPPNRVNGEMTAAFWGMDFENALLLLEHVEQDYNTGMYTSQSHCINPYPMLLPVASTVEGFEFTPGDICVVNISDDGTIYNIMPADVGVG